MKWDLRTLLTHMADIFGRICGVSEAEWLAMVAAMLAEFEEDRPYMPMKVVVGRRRAG